MFIERIDKKMFSRCRCKYDCFRTKICGNCRAIFHNVPLDKVEKQLMCRKHKKKVVYGVPDYICQMCAAQGWYSTKGISKYPELINSNTGERITII